MAELRKQISTATAQVADVLAKAHNALRGQAEFGPEHLRALQKPLDLMQPLMPHSRRLVREEPGLQDEFNLYRSQLRSLQATLEQIRVMLLARRAQMLADHAQLQAVSHWADALRQTQDF